MPRCTETMRCSPAPSSASTIFEQAPIDRGLGFLQRGDRGARLLVRPGGGAERAAFHGVDVEVVDDQDVVERGAQAWEEAGSSCGEFFRPQPRAGSEQPVVGPGVVVRHGAVGKQVTHGVADQ